MFFIVTDVETSSQALILFFAHVLQRWSTAGDHLPSWVTSKQMIFLFVPYAAFVFFLSCPGHQDVRQDVV